MKLVFDIETVGCNIESLSESQQEFLFRYAEKETDEQLKSEKVDEVKRCLSLYPYTAKIISIGLLREDTGNSMILFESDEKREWQNEDETVKYLGCSEEDMIIKFWEFAEKANQLITFNGRLFDIPFIMLRSAIHKIKPSRNLLGNRYKHDKHIDLLEEFTFHGTTKKFNLDFYCRAFGIESPKSKGITGMDVKQLYEAGRADELAIYCGEDIKATYELYKIWNEYLDI